MTQATAKAPRVKEVLGDELAHVWARQSQATGKNRSGDRANFYFRGPTIYSYGEHFPIATFATPRVVLFTTKGYSSTTAGHIWATRRAIPGDVQIIECENIRPSCAESHAGNVRAMLYTLEELARLQAKARKRDYRGEIARGLRNLQAYAKHFKVRLSKRVQDITKRAEDPEVWGALAGLTESEAKFADKHAEAARKRYAAEQERERVKRRTTLQSLLTAAIRSWRTKGDIRAQVQTLNQYATVGEVFNGLEYTALEVTGDGVEVITSEGAHISVETARRIWPVLKRRENPGDVEGYRGVGFRNDVLIIGCHHIPFAELEYIAGKLGLE